MFSLNFMFFCSLIEELCTKEENYKTSCKFNFGHECNIFHEPFCILTYVLHVMISSQALFVYKLCMLYIHVCSAVLFHFDFYFLISTLMIVLILLIASETMHK